MATSTITRKQVRAGTALSLAVAAAISAAPAWAEPVQPGTDPGQSGPQQGGTDPSSPQQPGTTPQPAPQPAPAPEPEPEPDYNPGPGLAPSPPQGNWQQTQPETTYPQQSYNPVPNGPLHTPRPTPPVKRKAPPPGHVRVGNFAMPVEDLPDLPMKKSDRDKAIVSVNEWSAYSEAEIARFLISIGVPEDEASRQAAAAMIGIAAGGGIGFGVGFTATAIVTGPVVIPIATGVGCLVGAGVGGGNPVSTLGGCGIGLASGVAITLGTATAVGTATGVASAAGGGLLAWLLGAGDKNAHPERPDLPWDKRPKEKPELPNPGGNQFEVHLPAEKAQQGGLPAVDYTVTRRGDVNVKVGSVDVGWTAEQAQAPIKALGPAAPVVEKAINDTTKAVGDVAEKVVDGLDVQWPQLQPQSQKKSPSTGGKHRRH